MSEKTRTDRAEVYGVLQEMRRMLTLPTAWLQGRYAVDLAGSRTLGHKPEACRWCLIEAIAGASQRRIPRMTCTARSALNRAVGRALTTMLHRRGGTGFLTPWNDAPERTHRQVLALITTTMEGLPTIDLEDNDESSPP